MAIGKTAKPTRSLAVFVANLYLDCNSRGSVCPSGTKYNCKYAGNWLSPYGGVVRKVEPGNLTANASAVDGGVNSGQVSVTMQ